MKIWVLTVLVSFVIISSGCRTVEDVKESYEACMEDPNCVELVKNIDHGSRSVPSEYGWIAGLLLSNVVAVIVGSKIKMEKR